MIGRTNSLTGKSQPPRMARMSTEETKRGRPTGTTKGKTRTEAQVTTHMPLFLRTMIDEEVTASPLDLTDWCREAFISQLSTSRQARVRRTLMPTQDAILEVIGAKNAPLTQSQVAFRMRRDYGGRTFSPEYLRRKLDLLVTEGSATRVKEGKIYKWAAVEEE